MSLYVPAHSLVSLSPFLPYYQQYPLTALSTSLDLYGIACGISSALVGCQEPRQVSFSLPTLPPWTNVRLIGVGHQLSMALLNRMGKHIWPRPQGYFGGRGCPAPQRRHGRTPSDVTRTLRAEEEGKGTGNLRERAIYMYMCVCIYICMYLY